MSRSGTPALVVNRGEGTVSVLKLGASPVAEIAKVALGKADTRSRGIDFTPDGQHLAGVVMNGSNKAKANPFYADKGLLQIWRVDGAGQRPVKVTEAPIGQWSQGALFSRDGKTVLAMNMVENDVQLFSFDGSSLKETARIKLGGGAAAGRTAGDY